MCVIFVLDKQSQFLTPDEIQSAHICNPDGIGLAYSDGERVHWHKGIKWHDLAYGPKYRTIKDIRPLVVHFRLATIGEATAKLCHPFHVSKFSPLSVHGTSKRAGLLFHNGHYGGYANLLTHLVPQEIGSDSHALAAYAGLHGQLMFDAPAFDWQKICILKKDDFQLYGRGWIRNDEDGIIRSNEYHLWDDDGYGYGLGYHDEYSNVSNESTYYKWDRETQTYIKRDEYDNPIDEFDPSLGMWAEGEDGKWRFVPWDDNEEEYKEPIPTNDEYYIRRLERILEEQEDNDIEWERYGG